MVRFLAQTTFLMSYSKPCLPYSINYFSYSLPIVISKDKSPTLGKQATPSFYTKTDTHITFPTIVPLHSLTKYINYSLALLQAFSLPTEKNTKSYTIVKRAFVPKGAPPYNYKLS